MRPITRRKMGKFAELFTILISRGYVASDRSGAGRKVRFMIMYPFISVRVRRPRSPMLLQLHTGRVEGYDQKQEPIIYAVSTVESIVKARLQFVFSDGHGIAAFTQWFDDRKNLDKVDWGMVYADYWADTVEDMDRQRRKQAEFLVHRFCPWDVVTHIGVLNDAAKIRVENILRRHRVGKPVYICRQWYY